MIYYLYYFFKGVFIVKKQSEILVNVFGFNSRIEMAHYQSNPDRIAMMLYAVDGEYNGELTSTVSTNIPYPFKENEIAVCVNNETRPVYFALIEQGVLLDTEKMARSGFAEYAICKLNFEVEEFVS